MGIVIGNGLTLSQAALLNPNQARLCWQSLLDPATTTATSETSDNPATNMLVPSTAFGWEATSTADQDIDFGVNGQIDYIGIARHNLSGAAEIRIRFLVGLSYFTVFDWSPVPNQQVLLYFINEAEPDGIQISIRNNATAPKIAVVYAGTSLQLQRRIYVGHTPINYGRTLSTVGGFSESGQYLGEVVRREGRQTNVSLQNLTPAWYRAQLDPFFAQRPRQPAFWAWRPGSYPAEVGYVWLSGSPQPSNQRSNGMMSVDFALEGIA